MEKKELEILKKKQAELDRRKKETVGNVKPKVKIKKPIQFRTNEEIEQWKKDHAPVQAPVQLDLFPEFANEMAAMPNTIARSALFAPVCRGRRKYINNGLIVSRHDVKITFLGQQLDMADSDVFLHAIRLASQHNLGTEFQILPYSFLNKLGRKGTGENNKKWLQRSLGRIKGGNLTIETKRYRVMLSLIDDYTYDKDLETHHLRINPKILSLFAREQYGLIDWDDRKAITMDLGKWLQTYIASNEQKKAHKISISKLKKWSGQEHRRLDHYITTLKKALQQLEDLKMIKDVSVSDKGVLTYTRV